MRPLFFEEPENENLLDYSSTYLWGRDFLVSPVLKQGQTSQEVYFPESSNWVDFYTGELIEGGQTKTINVKEAYIPTFVRSGAFVPMAKPMQSTKEFNPNRFELHYYHDSSLDESESELYIDDGKTINPVENKNYEILEFDAKIKGRWLEIEFEAEVQENYKSEDKTIDLIIHNVNFTPKVIKVDGKKVEINYSNNRLSIPLLWDTSKEIKVNIKR